MHQLYSGGVQLILYPGFVFIISIAIALLTGRHIFLSGAIPVNHLEVEKIRHQSAARTHLLVLAMPKSFPAPGNGQEKIVDLLILNRLNTFLANTIKICV